MNGPAFDEEQPLELDGDLWRFAVSFYADEAVASACISLQEEAGVDVSVLIFAIFATAVRGLTLSDADLREADHLIAEWRGDVVQPLRRLRKHLKVYRGPAPVAVTGALRNRVKAAELHAEQIELAVLANWLSQRGPNAGSPPPGTLVPVRVARYFGDDGAKPPPPSVEDAFRTLSLAIGKLPQLSGLAGRNAK